MHTPEQAKELWCPMARIARRYTERAEMDRNGPGETFISGGCNIDALGGTRVPTTCKCIADQCAMWRWLEFKSMTLRKIVNDPAMGPSGKREVSVTSQVGVKGYCGLAGRPA